MGGHQQEAFYRVRDSSRSVRSAGLWYVPQALNSFRPNAEGERKPLKWLSRMAKGKSSISGRQPRRLNAPHAEKG